MFILLSCARNRIVGVNQPVAFFAANAENISFVLRRRKVIRAFPSWVSVAARCGTGRGSPEAPGKAQAPGGAAGAGPPAEAPSNAPWNSLEMRFSLGTSI